MNASVTFTDSDGEKRVMKFDNFLCYELAEERHFELSLAQCILFQGRPVLPCDIDHFDHHLKTFINELLPTYDFLLKGDVYDMAKQLKAATFTSIDMLLKILARIPFEKIVQDAQDRQKLKFATKKLMQGLTEPVDCMTVMTNQNRQLMAGMEMLSEHTRTTTEHINVLASTQAALASSHAETFKQVSILPTSPKQVIARVHNFERDLCGRVCSVESKLDELKSHEKMLRCMSNRNGKDSDFSPMNHNDFARVDSPAEPRFYLHNAGFEKYIVLL